MKFKKVIGVYILALMLLLAGCAKEDLGELYEASFVDENSIYELMMNGETYYCIGATSYNPKHKEKIGYVPDNKPNYMKNIYAYYIDEFGSDFLYVHGQFEACGVNSEIYVRSGVEKIPWCFAEAGMPLQRNKMIFQNANYYLYSSSPKEFQVGREIGTALQNGKECQVYEIPGMKTESWVAIRYSEEDPYLIYYAGKMAEEIPWEYFEIQREYPGSEFFEDYPSGYDESNDPYVEESLFITCCAIKNRTKECL